MEPMLLLLTKMSNNNSISIVELIIVLMLSIPILAGLIIAIASIIKKSKNKGKR